MGGRLACSLAPLIAGLALGALALTVIEPAPRHEARIIHPAKIEPAAGIVADKRPVSRFAAVPRPIPASRVKSSRELVPTWRVHAVAAPPIKVDR